MKTSRPSLVSDKFISYLIVFSVLLMDLNEVLPSGKLKSSLKKQSAVVKHQFSISLYCEPRHLAYHPCSLNVPDVSDQTHDNCFEF